MEQMKLLLIMIKILASAHFKNFSLVKVVSKVKAMVLNVSIHKTQLARQIRLTNDLGLRMVMMARWRLHSDHNGYYLLLMRIIPRVVPLAEP